MNQAKPKPTKKQEKYGEIAKKRVLKHLANSPIFASLEQIDNAKYWIDYFEFLRERYFIAENDALELGKEYVRRNASGEETTDPETFLAQMRGASPSKIQSNLETIVECLSALGHETKTAISSYIANEFQVVAKPMEPNIIVALKKIKSTGSDISSRENRIWNAFRFSFEYYKYVFQKLAGDKTLVFVQTRKRVGQTVEVRCISESEDTRLLERKLLASLKRVIPSADASHSALLMNRLFLEDVFRDVKIHWVSEPQDERTYTFKIIPQIVATNTRENLKYWDQFLSRVDDPEAFGAYIWAIYEPEYKGKQFLYLMGRSGNDGKSTIASAIMRHVGERNSQTVEPNDFASASSFATSALIGRRLVVVPEVSNAKLLFYPRFKSLTGNDNMRVEPKGRTAFSMPFECRVLCHGNYPLETRDIAWVRSRTLWLKVDAVTDHSTPASEWEKGLSDEYVEFLRWCKWCYSMRTEDNRNIVSEVSNKNVTQNVGSEELADVLDGLESKMDMDPTKTSWFVTRVDFRRTVSEIVRDLGLGKCREVMRELKDHLGDLGFRDFHLVQGGKHDIDGVRMKGYHGLRVKKNGPPPPDAGGENKPDKPRDMFSDPTEGAAGTILEEIRPARSGDYIVVDFETYTDQTFSIKNMSTYEYISDDRFRVLGMGIWTGQSYRYITQEQEIKLTLRNHKGKIFAAHNAFFDAMIAKYHYGVEFAGYYDTMGYLLATGRDGALAVGGELVGLKKLEIDLENPEPAALETYCIRDVEICRELYRRAKNELSDTEHKLNSLSILRSLDGIFIDHSRCQELLEQFDREIETASALADKTLKPYGISVADIDRTQFIKDKIKEHTGCALPTIEKTSPSVISAKQQDDDIQTILSTRDSVRSLRKHRTDTARMDAQEKIYGAIKYCGAGTGRWAAGGSQSGKINLQNLPAHSSTKLANQIRTAIVPRYGYTFISCDLAAIEARVVAYMSGTEKMLTPMLNGEDIYCSFARDAFGREIDKKDPFRKLCKVAILSLGYGMGKRGFSRRVESTTEFSVEDAERAYELYHLTYPNVKQMMNGTWKMWEHVFENCGSESDWGVTIRKSDTDMYIVLPSGRELVYRNVTKVKDGDWVKYTYENKRAKKLWCGTLIENICQAIARDILGEHILAIESKGWRVLFTVHDEVVVEVEDSQLETARAEILDIMKSSPEWAKSLPLDAEINEAVGKTYVK